MEDTITVEFVVKQLRGVTEEHNLQVCYPEIAKQWSDRNEISPEKCAPKTDKSAWWVCDKGHEYDAPVNSRTGRGSGCPYCAGMRVMYGFNDLETVRPDIAKMWDYEKNGTLTPRNVVYGSGKDVWWTCIKHGSWKGKVVSVTRSNKRCPKCRLDFDGIDVTHPDIAKQFSKKNKGLHPRSFSFGSNKKVWWDCPEGHDPYVMAVCQRTIGRGCPVCNTNCSQAERYMYDIINSLVDTKVIRGDRSTIAPYELDISIPDKNIAIEFNGVYWHSEKKIADIDYHYKKWKMCQDAGVSLFTFWEDDWNNRRELVELMIRSQLGVVDVSACDLSIATIYRDVARDFLDTYHFYPGEDIQDNVEHAIGLVDDSGDVVAVLSFYEGEKEIYIARYAFSRVVDNGFTTLLEVVKEYALQNGYSGIVGVSDNQYCDGSVFSDNDFDYVCDVPPRRWSVVKNNRILGKVLGMKANTIWDCGRVRWEYEV